MSNNNTIINSSTVSLSNIVESSSNPINLTTDDESIDTSNLDDNQYSSEEDEEDDITWVNSIVKPINTTLNLVETLTAINNKLLSVKSHVDSVTQREVLLAQSLKTSTKRTRKREGALSGNQPVKRVQH
jgi:hypothetical protein